MRNFTFVWSLLFTQLFLGVFASRWGASSRRWSVSRQPDSIRKSSLDTSNLLGRIRGGTSADDEERYSRQVYTLGARAHGLVRSATVYVDGPSKSGLLYECVKNLALSGVGKIVIVTSDEEIDAAYHLSQLDDLGRTYIRGACAEIGLDDDDTTSHDEILLEFLYRLNPSLKVEKVTREELCDGCESAGILLCVDRPYDTQVHLNQLCRNQGFPFVAVETAGVYGRTFCDFGSTFDIHDVDGETPLVVPLDHVDIMDDDEQTMLVHCVSGERHDVSKGDAIQFQLPNGDVIEVSCSVTQVKSPELISIKLDSSDNSLEEFVAKVNAEAPSFSRLKKLEQVTFTSLDAATMDAKENAALFTPCDFDKSFDDNRRSAVFSCFQALNTFVKSNRMLPKADDWVSFSTTAKAAALDSPEPAKNLAWEKHCRLFVNSCAAKLVPLQAIFGAVAAQECLKAASGLYNPIRQFLLYDCDEVISSRENDESDEETCTTSGLGYIVGRRVEEALQNEKLFVVGAGAIGCEILKNLAAMGAGAGKKGSVIVTDMDTIERSNLSRQLLFRDGDIGKFKSKAAQEAIYRLNPSLKMECHTSKVGGEEHGPFDSKFWSKDVDVVLNALDNVEARLFMDGQCVANKKALVDAGTLGSKGNVQVIIPHQSESYGSSADPPEAAIPVCTLKNFPYAISHTIQWGRDLFDGLFVRRPKQGNQYAELLPTMGVDNLGAKLEHDLGDQAALGAARELSEDLSVQIDFNAESLRDACIEWGIDLAEGLFHDTIEKLLIQHPTDSLDEDGEPFWSGSRKVPKSLSFSSDDEIDSQQEAVDKNFIDFVKAAARLRIETFRGQSVEPEESIVTSGEVIAAARRPKKMSSGDDDSLEKSAQARICASLKPLSSFSRSKRPLNAAEFEKDDDSNGHVAFITAASNLRAICYGIPPVDAMETRRVAGRIVPAMITTTAFVSALSGIELLKLVQGFPLNRYRNAFINLALPFFAFTAPLPAEEVQGLRGQSYTLWDRITIKEGTKAASSGGITLRRFLKRLKKKACEDPDTVEISTVSFGQFMIYANFLNEDDEELLDKNLWDAVQEAVVAGNEFDREFSRNTDEKSSSPVQMQGSTSLDLTVVVEDLETGEEVELPPVRVLKSKT
jgi:ubiquitin-activating enzyme E1